MLERNAWLFDSHVAQSNDARQLGSTEFIDRRFLGSVPLTGCSQCSFASSLLRQRLRQALHFVFLPCLESCGRCARKFAKQETVDSFDQLRSDVTLRL